MNQAILPSDLTGDAAGSRALQEALDMRAAARRARFRKNLLSLVIVLACTLLALGYAAFVQAPRYEAETRFSVRASSGASSAAPPSSFLTTGSNEGAAMGFVDGFAVNDYLRSRDAMLQLGEKIDLRLLLPQGVGNSARKPTEDELFEAYGKAISVNFNVMEQVNVLKVSAFSPSASQRIASELLVLAQDFVSRMDAQGVADSIAVAERRLRDAETRDLQAGNAIARWRAANNNVDPQAESAMIMQLISQIEQQLNAARLNYAKIAALNNAQHPLLEPARDQVTVLERQLAEARGRLTGSGNSQASRIRSYEQLKNSQTFANSNLEAARNGYQQAFLQTMRLRRYVTVIARPLSQQSPSSPRLALAALEGFLAGILLAFLFRLATDTVRIRRR